MGREFLNLKLRYILRLILRGRGWKDRFITFLACILILTYLKIYDHRYFYHGTCPTLLWMNSSGTHGDRSINCSALIEGDMNEIKKAKTYQGCEMKSFLSDVNYIEEASNCVKFRRKYYYDEISSTEEEKDFPIAYSILMYEDVYQMETLLRLIYKPQNVYCIHVDKKSPSHVQEAVKKVTNCLSNVFVASKLHHVTYGQLSIVESEISCLRDLWFHKTWKYFINLTGKELPIRTNAELVKILKAYNGGNDVQGFKNGRPKSWTAVRWKSYGLPLPLWKGDAPHNYSVTKGSTHIAVSRKFVDFVLHNQTAIDLLAWMHDIRVPDEHFFNTLSHSPHLNIPGAFIGVPDDKPSLNRYKLWRQDKADCGGSWIHGVCNFGPGDLQHIVKSRALFANKFKPKWNPITYKCLAMWHRRRTFAAGFLENFNIGYYNQQKWVDNHV